jgi:Asp-tRNA(Asn)/Glu-tRNA(Gln) amidotransferase A subunit family amidase
MNFEAARALAHERFRHPELLSETLRTTLQQHGEMPRSRYEEAMTHARACRNIFDGLFGDVDVLLTPSAPGEAPKGLESTGSSLFNRNWTLLGAPCVTVPFGRGESGLPLGIQIVGRYDDDARVLMAAEWVRQRLRDEG